MKNFALSAAAAAAFTTLVAFAPVSAQSAGQDAPSGHYEWRSIQQAGPRAPLRAPARIWVSNHPGDSEQGVGGPYCDVADMGKPAHYAWLPSPQAGPRDPLRPPTRVWVEC
jgi:hypothetical protein